MRKILLLVLFISTLLYSQGISYLYRIPGIAGGVTATGNTGFSLTAALPASYAGVFWTVIGTLNSCTIQVDYSVDGSTVSGQLVSAQSCTSSGSSIAGSTSTPTYARVSYVIGSGGGTLLFNAFGCSTTTCLGTTTSGGGGGGSVTQGTVPWVDSITQWGGGTLGAMANYGSSPGAVLVPGVNAFVTNTVAENITQTAGATLSATNPLFDRITDGTTAITADVSAYGSAPTGTEALGVNAFVTNTVTTNFAPTTTVNGAASISSQSSLTTAVVVKASAGNVYGFQVTNGAASTCYLEFMNSASGPSLGANAVFSIQVAATPGTQTFPVGSLALDHFTTGISVGMANAYNGSSPCGTAATAVIFYQ